MDWTAKAIPTLDSRPEEIEEYMKRMIDPLSPRRRWHTIRAAMRQHMYRGNQWLLPQTTLTPSVGAYHFRAVYKKSLASFPHPVTNFVKPAVKNDVARLGKKEYVPEASASKNKPQWVAAAEKARDILMAEAQRAMWAQKREELIFNLVVDGTAIAKTFRDEINTELVMIAALDAVWCSACGLKLASSQIPTSFMEGFPDWRTPGEMMPLSENSYELPDPVEIPPGHVAASMRLVGCPACGGELSKYEVDEEEALEGKDSLGNPLCMMIPKTSNGLQIVSMHDFYPENGGVKRQPWDCRVWHQQSVVDLETIVERYPELEDEIQPEDPEQLLLLDPMYSMPALAKQSPRGSGFEVYANATRLREVVVAPSPRCRLGAHFVQAGDGPILKAPLCVEVEGENGPILVPRIKYHVGRYDWVPGEFWGSTFVEDICPINRRLNEIDAQGMDLRERGKPMLYKPEGVELNDDMDSQGSMGIVEYEGDSGWDPRSSMFPGVPLTANPYSAEREQCIRDMQMLGAPQDIERGSAPGGIKTTSGLMLVSEQAEQHRAPVERGLVGIYEGVFQHWYDLCRTFQVDGGEYERRSSETGSYETKSWKQEELLGGMKVKVTARAGFDNTLYMKEASGEAMQMGLYDASSPVARERILENMKLPKVNETVGVQIKRAEMAWSEFLQTKAVPLIDETLFSADVWFDLLGKHWMEEECLELQTEAGFDAVMNKLAGWKEELAAAEAKDQQQRLIYGKFDPSQWAGTYAALQQAYEQAAEAEQALSVPPDQRQPPPPKPPEGGFLPKPKQLRILAVWSQMLGPAFQDGMVAATTAEVLLGETEETKQFALIIALLRMRAMIEALGLMVAEQRAAMLPPAAKPGVAP